MIQQEEILTVLQGMLHLSDDFHSRLGSLRVTPLEAGMMMYLNRHPGRTISDVANRLGTHELTLDTRVQDLVRKGFIRKRSDRQYESAILTLTSEGKVIVPAIAKHIQEISALICEVSSHAQADSEPSRKPTSANSPS